MEELPQQPEQKNKLSPWLLGILVFVIFAALGTSGYFYFTLHTQLADSEKQIIDLKQQFAADKIKLENSNKELQTELATIKSVIALNSEIKGLDLTQFQAVHLNNGKVYFGKITDVNLGFLVIQHIYYLQGGGDENTNTSMSPTPISLVKYGNELEGPKDSMTINITDILSVATMKSDSQVLQAIQQNEAAAR